MSSDLLTVLADYRAGLDAELVLLEQLEALSIRQRSLPHPIDAGILTAVALDRQRLLGALLTLEQQVAPARQQIAARLAEAHRLTDFPAVAERHTRAADLVARIMQIDAESLRALERAEHDRRLTAQSLETGEATLAAYRRVLQQPHGSAGLFTQKG